MKKTKTGLILGCALGLISAVTIAGPKYYIETLYYSDASYSEHVGEKSRTCTGRTYVTGQVTSYSRVLIKERCRP